jgi:hypothetical protein
LRDCAALGRVLAHDLPPAADRCKAVLGVGLAVLLRSAFTGDHTREQSQVPAEPTFSARRTLGLAYTAPGRERLRPATARILPLHPERPTAVSLGVGRNDNRRMVSTVGASEARASKAARNNRLLGEPPTRPASAEQVELACECGDEACPQRVLLTAEEYAFLRRVPGYYAVCYEHVGPDDHVIVGEPGRFAIVE